MEVEEKEEKGRYRRDIKPRKVAPLYNLWTDNDDDNDDVDGGGDDNDDEIKLDSQHPTIRGQVRQVEYLQFLLVAEGEPVGQADEGVETREEQGLLEQQLVHTTPPGAQQLHKPTQGCRGHPVLVDNGHGARCFLFLAVAEMETSESEQRHSSSD